MTLVLRLTAFYAFLNYSSPNEESKWHLSRLCYLSPSLPRIHPIVKFTPFFCVKAQGI